MQFTRDFQTNGLIWWILIKDMPLFKNAQLFMQTANRFETCTPCGQYLRIDALGVSFKSR